MLNCIYNLYVFGFYIFHLFCIKKQKHSCRCWIFIYLSKLELRFLTGRIASRRVFSICIFINTNIFVKCLVLGFCIRIDLYKAFKKSCIYSKVCV